MTETVTLELPEHVLENARQVAINTQRRIEDVLVEWIDRAASDLPVDSLSDKEILELCDLQLNEQQQDELSNLLARNSASSLTDIEHERLDALMQLYRHGMVRKSQALKVAVARGLKSSLN